jgi:hypothetical protein
MNHRPDLAEEGCDQGVVEIHENKDIIARIASIFRVCSGPMQVTNGIDVRAIDRNR